MIQASDSNTSMTVLGYDSKPFDLIDIIYLNTLKTRVLKNFLLPAGNTVQYIENKTPTFSTLVGLEPTTFEWPHFTI